MAPTSPYSRRPLHRVMALGSACVVGLLLLNCQASVKGDARASSSGPSEVNFDAEGKRDEAWESTALPTSGGQRAKRDKGTLSTARAPHAPAAMLGARHDLTLSKGALAACKCLAVIAGTPSQSGLAWAGLAPVLDTTSQLAIGLSSNGVACDVKTLAASYMGYEVRESNVVVLVEGAVAGRPLTEGAIIPKPMPGGRVVIESSGGLPYGQPLSGSGACTLAP